ncbi:hypothetical protein ACWDSJ_17585 [Nocardia sp. NPDC003482]
MDYVRPQDNRPERIIFVFDGGILTEPDLNTMALNPTEILSAAFCSLKDAAALVKPLLVDRLSAALEAVHDGVTVLCEQGRRIT